MKYLYNNFYINQLGNYICPLCYYSQKNVIDYNYQYCKCFRHNKDFISYCSICNNSNLCEKCEEAHRNHRVILFKEMKILNQSKIKKIKNIIKLSLSKIYNYNYELTIAKDIFESLIINEKFAIEGLIKYYKKYLFFTENFTNYETIINLLNFQELPKVREVNNFLNEKNEKKNSIFRKR